MKIYCLYKEISKELEYDDDNNGVGEEDPRNIINQQTDHDHEFTEVKARKMTNKRVETTTVVTHAHNKKQ